MNNSFYGGRDGQPMIIKKKYSTVTEMLEVFKDPSNLEVNFGEYAIIETINRNNPENGRIFRRGSDYNNKTNNMVDSWILNTETNVFENQSIEAHGAIFISQIVGSSGNAPHLHLLSSIQDVKDKYIEKENQIKEAGELGETIHLGDNNAFGPNFDIKQGYGMAGTAEELSNLVPGKVDENTFNDNIKWHYCSVRDENQQETDAYIGFEIPYTVIEFQANSVDPYFNRTDKNNPQINFINNPLVEGRTDDGQHPFYEKWKINIPKGIHGESIEGIQVGVAAEDIYTFDFTDKNIADSRDKNGKLKVKAYDGRDDDIINSRQVVYCTIVDYDRIPEGDKYNIYLGDYNMIKKITIDEYGTITIDYTHDDTEVWKNLLTWPTNIKVNDNGTITTEYNNEDPSVQGPTMNWITSAILNEQKVLNIDYVNTDDNISVNLKTPNEIILDGDTFYATYNTNPADRVKIGSVGSNTLDATVASTEEEIDSGLRVGGIAFMTQEN